MRTKIASCNTKRVQCDEIWAFCHSKQKNVPDEHRFKFGYGDVWTWVAIDVDSKLVPCWYLGRRAIQDAHVFVSDLASRVDHRIELITDGLLMYRPAVEAAFGSDVDFGQLIKIYANDSGEGRYSPPACIGSQAKVITGSPGNISTSHIERQNLTMRMQMRRMTRLTNGFSKKAQNLSYALALHFMYYNFVKKHSTIGTTPAIAAGVTQRIWTVRDLVHLPDVLRSAEESAA
jgi:IS1 family transposase